MPLLELRKVSKHFAGLAAVSDLDLEIVEGEIRGLIGPNGSGKTTVFNITTGVYKLEAGRIVYRGEDITGKPPNFISRRGLARTFQQVSLFASLTVAENVMMALYIAHEAKSPEDSERKLEEEILDILSFVGISQFKDRVVADLPLGHQRATQIAIALGTKPHLLLLDEPLSGMNPRESGEMVEIFRRIRESGVTILWIEHEMSLIMGSCDKITVLDFGYKLAEGSPQEIRNNQAVIEAYLGKGK